ncbi:MAG: response regulator transcription factor [Bacteroidetes bacterium]|nr:response regulator transcription factor [Bacteroidota bacterium]
MKIKVAIVEDDSDLRSHFENLVINVADFHLVGAFPEAESFENQFKYLKPDVVLMDINLPGKSGIECIKICKKILPETQFLIVTVFEDSKNLFDALCSGATGYLLKISGLSDTEKAIRDIYSGGSPMSPQIARFVINALPETKLNNAELDKLSKREREILELLSEGYRYKEIASKLFLGVDTVRTYIRNIYSVLQVHSRTEAINKAFGR